LEKDLSRWTASTSGGERGENCSYLRKERKIPTGFCADLGREAVFT